MYENSWVLENSIVISFKVYIGKSEKVDGKNCIRLTSEEKERLIEFKKSDKFLKAYKLIKEEIGLEERNKLYFRLKVLFCLFLLVKFFPLGIYLSFFAFIIFMTYAVLKEEKNMD